MNKYVGTGVIKSDAKACLENIWVVIHSVWGFLGRI